MPKVRFPLCMSDIDSYCSFERTPHYTRLLVQKTVQCYFLSSFVLDFVNCR